MTSSRLRAPGSFMLALVLLALLAPACGSEGPKERRFTIQLEGGQPVGGTATFQVKQNDTVTFAISSDAQAEVHLHGYDLEQEVAPGETATLSFAANATGRFLIEVEDTEAQVGYLEVLPR